MYFNFMAALISVNDEDIDGQLGILEGEKKWRKGESFKFKQSRKENVFLV